MNYLEKTFKVPSNGVFGGPKKITLREMTTREEKILLGTRDFSVFERLVKSCCVDEDLDFNNLHTADIMYLTFMIRNLTYGPEYIQEVTCPHCGQVQQVTINIDEMTPTILSDENVKTLADGILVELSNGDKVTINMLSMGDANNIERVIKSKVKQGRLKDPESYEMVLRLATSISLIEPKEDEEIDYNDINNKVKYVDQLRMKDLSLIQNALNDFDFGLNRNLYRECESCGEDMEVVGYIVPEFFHPSK